MCLKRGCVGLTREKSEKDLVRYISESKGKKGLDINTAIKRGVSRKNINRALKNKTVQKAGLMLMLM